MMRREEMTLIKDDGRGRMRKQENESRVGCGLEKSDGQSRQTQRDFSAHAKTLTQNVTEQGVGAFRASRQMRWL